MSLFLWANSEFIYCSIELMIQSATSYCVLISWEKPFLSLIMYAITKRSEGFLRINSK